MSKTSLKKELALMTNEQLIQIILDSYDANPEFKEYYEYFLNPDERKLIEKHDNVVSKELGKSKWNYSKARVTVIKNAVKKFIGYNPGPEAVMNMLFLTLRRLGLAERCVDFKTSHLNYIIALVKQIIKYGEEHEMALQTAQRLQEEINYPYYTQYFKQHIQEGLFR